MRWTNAYRRHAKSVAGWKDSLDLRRAHHDGLDAQGQPSESLRAHSQDQRGLNDLKHREGRTRVDAPVRPRHIGAPDPSPCTFARVIPFADGGRGEYLARPLVFAACRIVEPMPALDYQQPRDRRSDQRPHRHEQADARVLPDVESEAKRNHCTDADGIHDDEAARNGRGTGRLAVGFFVCHRDYHFMLLFDTIVHLSSDAGRLSSAQQDCYTPTRSSTPHMA